jgi:hypothetical protein
MGRYEVPSSRPRACLDRLPELLVKNFQFAQFLNEVR